MKLWVPDLTVLAAVTPAPGLLDNNVDENRVGEMLLVGHDADEGAACLPRRVNLAVGGRPVAEGRRKGKDQGPRQRGGETLQHLRSP